MGVGAYHHFAQHSQTAVYLVDQVEVDEQGGELAAPLQQSWM